MSGPEVPRKGPFAIAFQRRQPGEEVPPPPPELVELSRNSVMATLAGTAYGELMTGDARSRMFSLVRVWPTDRSLFTSHLHRLLPIPGALLAHTAPQPVGAADLHPQVRSYLRKR